MLSSLHSHLREDSHENVEIHRNRCHLAEISSIRLLLEFVHTALTGEVIQSDTSFMDSGQIRDTKDYVQLSIKDLENHQKKCEQILEQTREKLFPKDLSMSKIHPSSAEVLRKIMNEETKCTNQVGEEGDKHVKTLRMGIAKCSDLLCQILIEALEKSAKTESVDTKRQLGVDAANHSMNIVKDWLTWYVQYEPTKAQTPPIVLPHAALLLTSADDDMADFIKAFRKCMHVKRQYFRLSNVSSRIDGAATIVDLLSSLKARIVLPTTLHTSL